MAAEYDLGTARGRVEIDSSGVGKGLASANAQLEAFEGKTNKTAQNLGRTGTVMAGAGLAIAGGLGIAVKAASDFETRISAIAAVSGATGSELEDLRGKALQLGADTAFSASEAAGAMEELVKAGLSVDEVLNGAADATVNLAAAGEVELVEAATLAANAMNAFGLSAEEMPKIADLIAGAANASAIDVSEFGMSLQQAGAVANLAGLSFDDTALAIAAMGNAGIKGSDAGTSLKTFLQNLQPVTEKQIGLFKELGIVTEDGANRFYDANGQVKSMAEISGVLSDALAGMTDQQKQMALETAFGSDAIRAAAIIADTGAAGFEDLATSMGKVTAAEVAETRMDNLGGSIEKLKGSVETLLILIGKPLADAMKVWIDRITGVINWLSELDGDTLRLITTIAKAVSAFLIVVGGLLVLVSVINKVKAAMTLLNASFLTNPIFLAIAAIVALGAALYMAYQRSEAFREIVDKVFGALKDAILPVLETVVDAFSRFWTVLTTGFTQDEGGAWFENLAFTIRDVAKWIRDVLIPAVIDFVGWLGREVVPVIQDVAEALLWLGEEIIERVVSGFEWFMDNVWPVLKETGLLFAALGKRIAQVVGVIVTVIGKLRPVFVGAFKAIQIVVETFLTIVTNLWKRFGDNLWAAIDLAFRLIKTIVEAGLRFIQGIIQVVTGIISGDWSKAWNGIKNMLGAVWDVIKAIPRLALDAIALIISTGLDYIVSIFENGWEIIKAGVRLLWNAMRTLFGSGFDKVMNFIRSIPGAIGRLAVTIWDGFKNGARAAVDGVVDFFRQLPGRIAGFIGAVGSTALNLGQTIIRKLAEGINGVIDSAMDFAGKIARAVKDVMNSIIRRLNDAFDFTLKGPGPLPDLHVNLPDIPQFHGGGTFNAKTGQNEGLALLKDQEVVLTPSQMQSIRDTFNGMMQIFDSLSQFSDIMPSATLSPSAGSGDITVVLEFPNVGSADDAEAIKEAVGEPSVLGALTRAIKAGTGSR